LDKATLDFVAAFAGATSALVGVVTSACGAGERCHISALVGSSNDFCGAAQWGAIRTLTSMVSARISRSGCLVHLRRISTGSTDVLSVCGALTKVISDSPDNSMRSERTSTLPIDASTVQIPGRGQFSIVALGRSGRKRTESW